MPKPTNRPRMGAPIKYSGGVKLRAVKVPLTDEEFERVKLIPPQERAERLLKAHIDAVVKPQAR